MRPLGIATIGLLVITAFVTAFAQDNRQEVQTFENILSRRIGIVRSSEQECTGFLIDSQLVLTSNHCIVDAAQTTFHWNVGYFATGELARQTVSAGHYCSGGFNPSQVKTRPQSDWAVLILSTPVPGITPLTSEIPFAKLGPDVGGTLVTLGYSTTFTQKINRQVPFYAFPCAIQEAPRDWSQDTSIYFLHNCEMGPGSSGSPIFLFADKQIRELVGLAQGDQPRIGLSQAITATNFGEMADAMIRAARENSLEAFVKLNGDRCR